MRGPVGNGGGCQKDQSYFDDNVFSGLEIFHGEYINALKLLNDSNEMNRKGISKLIIYLIYLVIRKLYLRFFHWQSYRMWHQSRKAFGKHLLWQWKSSWKWNFERQNLCFFLKRIKRLRIYILYMTLCKNSQSWDRYFNYILFSLAYFTQILLSSVKWMRNVQHMSFY